MIAVQRVPFPPLSEHVQTIWYYDGFAQPHRKERLLPDGTLSLVVNLKDDRIRMYDPFRHQKVQTIRGHVLSGARSGFAVIDTDNMVSTIGVHFRPGGAFPFLKIPACELNEQSVSLDQVWGEQGNNLRAKLLEARTPAAKFAVIERWLLERLRGPSREHAAVTFALRQFQQQSHMPVARIVDRLGMSQRRFIELFSAEVGLKPKVFSRVMRFQRAVQTIGGSTNVNWAALALECGYYDQAHFIHDFQAFSGITPSTYVASGPRYLNHVPLPEEEEEGLAA